MRDVLAKNPEMDVGGGQTPFRVLFALIDRNFTEAERVLAASPREDFQDIDYSFYFPKAWYEAMIARAKGDSAGAIAAFSDARKILEQRLAIKPEDAQRLQFSRKSMPALAAKNWRFKKRNTLSI